MIYNISTDYFLEVHLGKVQKKIYTRGRNFQLCITRNRCRSVDCGNGCAYRYGGNHTNAWGVVSSCIYGASLIILYTMSTLYHSFTNEKVKAFFRIMDHNTIFLLIAGTYTPITLYYLNGVTGWILFGIVWASAIFGIVMNSINLEKARIPSIFCYIGMGWVIIFAIKPLMEHMPSISGIFLIIGGVFYTVGIIFYAIKKVKYFHSIWHLFTVAGSVFHYFAILLGFFRI